MVSAFTSGHQAVQVQALARDIVLCAVFSKSASLHPVVCMSTGELNARRITLQ